MIGDIINSNTIFHWGKLKSMGNTVVLPLIQKQQELSHPHTGKVKVSVGLFSGSTDLACQGVISECG